METNSQDPLPQAVQDVIQATVDRAIATLIESGLLESKLKHKKHDGDKRKHSRSKSRSRSRSKSRKGRGKSKKRSSSSSSSSSSSDSECERKHKGKKGRGKRRSRSRSKSHGKGKGKRPGSRSHSRRRSGSRNRHHHGHGKRGGWGRHHSEYHHPEFDMLSAYYHHHFNCPCSYGGEGNETERPKHDGGRKGGRHGHKRHWMKFYCPAVGQHQQTTDDEKRDKSYSDKDTDLSKDFETLEVNEKSRE